MPYEYVLLAFEKAVKAKQADYHAIESPIALLTSVYSNSNRDPKKKREPYKMEDFFLYQNREDRNIPSAVFGSAGMELVKQRIFPQWALFTFKALKESSTGRPPELLAYIGEDVMVLAPVVDGRELKGMVIGRESAQGKERKLKSPCGQEIKILVPRIPGKVFAEENVSMHILR